MAKSKKTREEIEKEMEDALEASIEKMWDKYKEHTKKLAEAKQDLSSAQMAIDYHEKEQAKLFSHINEGITWRRSNGFLIEKEKALVKAGVLKIEDATLPTA